MAQHGGKLGRARVPSGQYGRAADLRKRLATGMAEAAESYLITEGRGFKSRPRHHHPSIDTAGQGRCGCTGPLLSRCSCAESCAEILKSRRERCAAQPDGHTSRLRRVISGAAVRASCADAHSRELSRSGGDTSAMGSGFTRCLPRPHRLDPTATRPGLKGLDHPREVASDDPSLLFRPRRSALVKPRL
jgi:hypothetical protein